MRSAAEERRMYSNQRGFDAYLWDIHKYGIQILEFMQGKSRADFEHDEMLRSGVERCLAIIGEALLQMSLYHPERARQIENCDAFIGLQRELTENYDSDHATAMWEAIERGLPVLIAEVSVLLDEWHQG